MIALVPLLIRFALVAVVAGAIWATYAWAYGNGETAERLKWQQHENTELTDANQKIRELQDAARQAERAHAQAMADASAEYQEELKNVDTKKDRIIADLRSGAIKLRIPAASTFAADGDIAAQAGRAPRGGDGETRCELSTAAAEFLVGLASEADEVVKQLAACQAVVTADRM